MKPDESRTPAAPRSPMAGLPVGLRALLLVWLWCGVVEPVLAQRTLFVTNGDAAELQAIDVTTGAILYSATTQPGAYPIAVRGTIWLGQDDNQGQAREYNVGSGSFTGNTAALSGPTILNLEDGATDGIVNYTLNAFGGTATVYAAAPDWTAATTLFNVSGFDLVGITYDSVAGSLWISDLSSMYEYSLAGSLVSQFSHAGGRGSVAYEEATDSLWFVPNISSNPLLQYSKAGTLLNSLTTPTRSGNIWGAEFQMGAAVPEPATMAYGGFVLTLGVASAWREWRRRKVTLLPPPDEDLAT